MRYKHVSWERWTYPLNSLLLTFRQWLTIWSSGTLLSQHLFSGGNVKGSFSTWCTLNYYHSATSHGGERWPLFNSNIYRSGYKSFLDDQGLPFQAILASKTETSVGPSLVNTRPSIPFLSFSGQTSKAVPTPVIITKSLLLGSFLLLSPGTLVWMWPWLELLGTHPPPAYGQ